MGGEAVWCSKAEWWYGSGGTKGMGTLGVSDPSPKPDRTAQGSNIGQIPVTSGCRNQGGLGQWKKLVDFCSIVLECM